MAVKELLRLLTIDPGDCTGWAYWKNNIAPVTGSFRIKTNREIHIHQQYDFLWVSFEKLLMDRNPSKVIIEGVEVYANSMKSQIAVKKRKGQQIPSLFKLAYLIGGYIHICITYNVEFEIKTFNEWGGNLTPEAVRAQVEYLGHKKYPSQHIYDAVGIGYSYLGRM